MSKDRSTNAKTLSSSSSSTSDKDMVGKENSNSFNLSTVVAITVSGFACIVVGATIGSWITLRTILLQQQKKQQQQQQLLLFDHSQKQRSIINRNDVTTTATTGTILSLMDVFRNGFGSIFGFQQQQSSTISATSSKQPANNNNLIDSKSSSTTNSASINTSTNTAALQYAIDCRRLLPDTIILVRHGESMANADPTIWKRAPDNLIGLTQNGIQQSLNVGIRIRSVLDTILQQKQEKQQQKQQQKQKQMSNDVDNDENDSSNNESQQQQSQSQSEQQVQSLLSSLRVHLVVSPFERTQQTAAVLRTKFNEWIVRTDIESRIREQEVGNIQDNDFTVYRQQQEQIGRFFYRFPTGESGADVFDRVKSWWYESILPVNLRVGYEPIDCIVVVTHGLTIRFILMQLFNWSPTTFHSVFNAKNCDMYILRKDLSKPGVSPYVLDTINGTMPQSSINLLVTTKDQTNHTVQLHNYLNVPPPRTMQIELIKRMLICQYPNLFTIPGTTSTTSENDETTGSSNNDKEIDTITFLPFAKCVDDIFLQPLRVPAGRRRNYNTENYSTILDNTTNTKIGDDDPTAVQVPVFSSDCETGYKVTSSLYDPLLLPHYSNNANTNEQLKANTFTSTSQDSSVTNNKSTSDTKNLRSLEKSYRFPYLSISDIDKEYAAAAAKEAAAAIETTTTTSRDNTVMMSSSSLYDPIVVPKRTEATTVSTETIVAGTENRADRNK